MQTPARSERLALPFELKFRGEALRLHFRISRHAVALRRRRILPSLFFQCLESFAHAASKVSVLSFYPFAVYAFFCQRCLSYLFTLLRSMRSFAAKTLPSLYAAFPIKSASYSGNMIILCVPHDCSAPIILPMHAGLTQHASQRRKHSAGTLKAACLEGGFPTERRKSD